MFSKSTIKYIQSLQHKKFRDQYNVFVAEGPKVVEGLLLTGVFNVQNIYALQEWALALDTATIQSLGEKLVIIKEHELLKIAAYTTPNKVVAVFEKRIPAPVPAITNKPILALDDIQDPGNLGTIIRTADWFGLEHIVCSEKTVDMYNSKVVQGTMASLGNIHLNYINLHAWLLLQNRSKVYAAVLEGTSIASTDISRDAVIIIGNESKGVSDELIQLAQHTISIPGTGKAESLNAAVATAIILSRILI